MFVSQIYEIVGNFGFKRKKMSQFLTFENYRTNNFLFKAKHAVLSQIHSQKSVKQYSKKNRRADKADFSKQICWLKM